MERVKLVQSVSLIEPGSLPHSMRRSRAFSKINRPSGDIFGAGTALYENDTCSGPQHCPGSACCRNACKCRSYLRI
jgi:hypothetical protein